MCKAEKVPWKDFNQLENVPLPLFHVSQRATWNESIIVGILAASGTLSDIEDGIDMLGW